MLCKIGNFWIESSLVEAVLPYEGRDGVNRCTIYMRGWDRKTMTPSPVCTQAEIDAFAAAINDQKTVKINIDGEELLDYLTSDDDEGCCGECHPTCEELDADQSAGVW